MDVTRENIISWLDTYFKDANDNQGPLEKVLNLKKYFTNDFEFMMYTAPSFFSPPLSREELLMLFVHPGLHEALKPKYYVVDVRQMIAVVQFELQFIDEHSGETWPPKQDSAHYHLKLDESEKLKIKKIQYWTESSSSEVIAPMYALWNKSKEKALTELAMNFLKKES